MIHQLGPHRPDDLAFAGYQGLECIWKENPTDVAFSKIEVGKYRCVSDAICESIPGSCPALRARRRDTAFLPKLPPHPSAPFAGDALGAGPLFGFSTSFSPSAVAMA